MKKLLILFIVILTISCIHNSKEKSNVKNTSNVHKQIKQLRKDDNYGFNSKINKEIYNLLNYPKVGYKDTLNSLIFEITCQKDTGGFYNKGVCWFVTVENFQETEPNWKTLYSWSNGFKYDMSALNEIFYTNEKLSFPKEKSRTKIIKEIIDNPSLGKKIIAMREINVDRNTFEKYPFN